jgi:hypothetical protein
MTKFEDRLFGQLMAEHGHHLQATARPAPARRRLRRPVWLATGAVGGMAAAAAAVVALGSAPAAAAYSVTQHANGAVTVSVNRMSGVAGANGTLHKMHARVRVVRVRPGCRPIGSLPRPNPAPHPSVKVASRVTKNGHRSVTVTLGKGGIPRGDTMILAFRGNPRGGTALGVGGIITGHVPHCVSLPPAP